MKLVLVILILSASFLVCYSQNEVILHAVSITNKECVDINSVFSDSIICWDNNRKLDFQDFKGDSGNDSMKGQSNTSITLDFVEEHNCYFMIAHSVFYKKTSWIALRDSYLLAHEQAHFDIEELFTRKLRSHLRDINLEVIPVDSFNDKCQTKVDSLYGSINVLVQKMQSVYDSETKHGVDIVKQKEWLLYIRQKLFELQMFSY